MLLWFSIGIVGPGDSGGWTRQAGNQPSNASSYSQLIHRTGGLLLEDIRIHPHRFRPKILRIKKREAVRKRVCVLRS